MVRLYDWYFTFMHAIRTAFAVKSYTVKSDDSQELDIVSAQRVWFQDACSYMTFFQVFYGLADNTAAAAMAFEMVCSARMLVNSPLRQQLILVI